MEKLSVIIPAYNEEKTIRQVIGKVKKAKVKGLQKEIIVVNDGSKDSTKDILAQLKDKSIKIYHHEQNKGKGAAVRTGVDRSTGDILIIQDADLEYDPGEYQKILKPLLEKRTKVVYGSRIDAIKKNLEDMYLS